MRLSLAICASALALLGAAAVSIASPERIPSAVLAGGPQIKWNASTSCLIGSSYRVHIELAAPAGGTVVAGWLLTPSAFTVNGKLLVEREDKGSMSLPEGAKITLDLDLGPYLKVEKDFLLGYASGIGDDKPVAVKLLEPAVAGLNFMDEKSVPLAELKRFNVLLQTNRGDMILELWPDTAPNHVRNFLDLSYTSFYSGTIFQRVIADFMIQGGDPTGTGSGSGPRTLTAEFSSRKHERGVLSMARSDDPNSASSQFFIMRAAKTHLDGLYSAFGKLLNGYETLDAIATAPTGPGDRPLEAQKILKATVILATPPK